MGWSGVVIAQHIGFDITPRQHQYSNVRVNMIDGFSATARPRPTPPHTSRTTLERVVTDDPGVQSEAVGESSTRSEMTNPLTSIETAGEVVPAPVVEPASDAECDRSSDCEDNLFCTGKERCVLGACVAQGNPCPTGTLCNEATDRCVPPECLLDSDCDDGEYCNGNEICLDRICVGGGYACPSGFLCDPVNATCFEALDPVIPISGTITLVDTLGARPPIGQVTLAFTSASSGVTVTVTSDVNGNYSHLIPPGWTGKVTADDTALDHCLFLEPVTRSYRALVTDPLPNQDFIAWCPPIGIPTPEFGISQTHRMYDFATTGAQYDRGSGLAPYPDEGNGPYTHYVDNTGGGCHDGNNNGFGSPTEPLCRFPQPIPAGSVVEIHGGPYDYNNTGGKIRMTAHGTAALPVFVRGVPDPELPTIESLIVIQGEYIVFENLVIRPRSVEMRLLDNDPAAIPHHAAIRGCAFDGTQIRKAHGGDGGIGINGGPATSTRVTDIVVYNNHIHDGGQSEYVGEDDIHGVTVGYPARDVWILDNHIHHNGGDSIQVAHNANFTTDHVYIGRNYLHDEGENAVDIKQADDVIVSQNIMHDFEEDFGSSPGEGFVVHNDPHRVWVLYNTIYNANIGLISTGCDPFFAIGNVVHDSSYRAIDFRGPGTVHVVGNTVSRSAAGIHGDNGVTVAHLVNNIITELTDPAGFHIEYVPGLAKASDMYHNLLYQEAEPVRIVWGTVEYAGIAAFQAGTGKGQGSLEVSPQFADAFNDDFHLQPGSLAIGSAIASEVYDTFSTLYGITIRVDFDGIPRPVGEGYDIGAFEHTP